MFILPIENLQPVLTVLFISIQEYRAMVHPEKEGLSMAISRMFFTTLLLITAMSVSCAQNDTKDDAEWLIDVLEIEEGSVVAEVGAGDGDLTLAMARHVGPGGQVYSSELGADSVQYLQKVVDDVNVNNVTVIEGHSNRTNFPEECCDALFMRRVYHHFEDPSAMNQSIRNSLKPGGRIALIDFAPSGTDGSDSGNRSLGPHHGVTLDTVVKELRKAGFTLVSSEQASGREIYVVMEKSE